MADVSFPFGLSLMMILWIPEAPVLSSREDRISRRVVPGETGDRATESRAG
jgi:hypothetical protein